MRVLTLASLFAGLMLAGCASDVDQQVASNSPPVKAPKVPAPGDATYPSDGVVGDAPEVAAFPAAHPSEPSIPKNGGVTLSAPSIVTITFPDFELESAMQGFDAQVGGLDWWHVLDEYNVAPAVDGGDVTLTDAAPAHMFNSDVQALIKERILDGTLPAPTDQTIYFLYVPGTTQVEFSAAEGGGSSCSEFLGFHDSFAAPVGPNGASMQVVYAVGDDCGGGQDDLTDTASHEIAEAVTDPHPSSQPAYTFFAQNAWTLAGGEVGDMCSEVGGVTEAGFYLTRVWSNANAKIGQQPCQPVPPETMLPFFDAGVVKGELSASPGQSVSTEVDCYSFGALPNDMTITVHANSKSVLTPTLDQSTCKNGDKLMLSFEVDASAQKGTSYHYTVTATVDDNNQHVWRGEVNVK